MVSGRDAKGVPNSHQRPRTVINAAGLVEVTAPRV